MKIANYLRKYGWSETQVKQAMSRLERGQTLRKGLPMDVERIEGCSDNPTVVEIMPTGEELSIEMEW